VIAFPLSFGFPAYTSIDVWAGSLVWSIINKATGPLFGPSSSFGKKHLAKKPIFQDLPLMPQQAGEERWRWLYGQLRAAILDRRLRPGARMPNPATWRSNTVSRAARSWPHLIILEVKATSKCEWAQARSWPRPYLTKLLPAVAVRSSPG
jgi:hypothetical protein